MKKIRNTTVIFNLVAFSLLSCNKSNINPVNQEENKISTKTTDNTLIKKSSFNLERYAPGNNKAPGWFSCCTYYHTKGVCIAIRKECLEEIVVDASYNKKEFITFVEAVEAGGGAVSNFFRSKEAKTLFPGMQKPEINDLAEKVVTFIELESSDKNYRYFGNVDFSEHKENYYVVQFRI